MNTDLDEEIKKLSKILIAEKKEADLAVRGEKFGLILRLLGSGTVLTLAILAPASARTLSKIDFWKKYSDWDEWKVFNNNYLKFTLKKLEKQKLVEIKINGDKGIVVLTENGKKKVLENAVSEMTINKPAHWDHKWRIVLYDINYDKKGLRNHFQKILKNAGFYQLQESVYIHAYPCEREIEFMRNFLGLAGEVRLVIAETIENDHQFRDYFAV